MKKIYVLPLAAIIASCSGIASEAVKDENNPLIRPTFMGREGVKQTAVVEIYTKASCPFCVQAKELLNEKKITYTEYEITDKPLLSSESISRSGGKRTVPQIFINGKSIGGYSELKALDSAGELDKLISE